MTEKKINTIKKVLLDTYDLTFLASDEGRIFSNMACEMTEGLCSLDPNAPSEQNVNAHLLIHHSEFLNLINLEMLKRYEVLSKVNEIYSEILYDLNSDEEACRSAALFEKYFGGDND